MKGDKCVDLMDGLSAPSLVDVMRLGVLQLDPEQAPLLEELPRQLDDLAAAGAQVLVLPELWNATFEAGRLRQGALASEDELSPLLEWTERNPGLLLCPGSLPLEVTHGGPPFLVNRSWLLQSGRVLARYDKLHLFGPMGEPQWVRPGNRSCLCPVEMPQGRLVVGLAICYDLRFPELFRDLAGQGAELILLPAQWPRHRHRAFHHLLLARAMENGITVVGVNRQGCSGGTEFNGGSAAYGMGDGQVFLAPCYEHHAVVAELDLAAVRRERTHLDAVADRRYRLVL